MTKQSIINIINCWNTPQRKYHKTKHEFFPDSAGIFEGNNNKYKQFIIN